MPSRVLTVHKTKHQYTSSRNAPQEPWTLNHFLMGLIMRGRRVNDWHIKEFISHVHKKNWNRTETEQWLRPQGFPYRFSSEILFMSMTHLLYHLYNSRRPIPPEVPCFLQQRLRLNDAACTLRQRFIFRYVELHVDRNRQIPSAICRGKLLLESRTAVCFSVIWCPQQWQLTLVADDVFL